ncbi:MAG: hypothetical protein ABI411_12580 [Tahibacter sp.]
MSPANTRLVSAIVLASASVCTSTYASVLVPEQPIQFERISLRQQVDSCEFNPSTVDVRFNAGIIQVFEQPNACLLPGPPALVDIQLGAFPAGTYRVEIRNSLSAATPPVEQLNLVVQPVVHASQSPAAPYPLTDYSGHWWIPTQAGWGLSLQQGALYTLFGVLSVFRADRSPEWFTLQAGTWTSSSRWTGKLVRTTGPAVNGSQPLPDSTNVDNTIVGTASLDFGILPGSDGSAQFSYTIDGSTFSAGIARVRVF